MSLEIVGFAYWNDAGHDVVTVHIEQADGTYNMHTFGRPSETLPELAKVIEETKAALQGAIALRMREALQTYVPQSSEPVKVGLCKMCNKPVSSDEPGVRVNGPFFYCKTHA